MAIPTLFIVTVIVFSLVRTLPGDVVDMMVEDFGYASNLDELRRSLGLDRPIYEQYISWIGGVLRADWGQSLWTKRKILDEVGRYFPVTLELAVLSLFISMTLAIPIGVLSAIRQDTMSDYIARTLAISFLAVPGFWLATLVVVLPSVWWRWSVNTEYVPLFKDPLANLSQFIFPAVLLGAERTAGVMRMTRAMMLEVLRQDYIRTAWAKGLRERVVIYRHAIKNALIPVVTIIGLQIPFYIGGSVIMESIFALPGMGQFMFQALVRRDYPTVQAINLIVAVFVLFINLAVDLTYGYLDPRIRYQ